MAKKRNKEAHNALLRQYIKEIENPDRHGFIGGKWVQSPYKDDDPNNRGYGVDVFYNKAAAKLTEGRPERWLTEDEERMLRNKHIKEVNKAAKDHYFPYLRRTPLSEEKEIMATGLLYRGDHINGTKLADPYYNGSNTDFQKAVEDYYRSKNLNDRAWRSKEFMDTHKVVDSPAPISLESPYVPMEYVGYHPNEGYYYAGELPQAEVFGEHKHAEGGMLYGNEGNMPNTPQEEYQDDYQSDDTVPQETPRQWDELSLSEKNAFIASAVKHGITNMEDIKNAYNELSQGQMDAAPEEEEEGNKFLKGGYKPSRNIKNYIANKEGASMKTNRSFEEEAQSFWSVLPKDVRSKLTQKQADALYSYSYNVGAGNFKHRVVPALQRYFSGNGSMEDVQRHMYATKDSQLRGLANRRAEERAMFAGSKVPVYYDTPNDTPTANMSSAWRSSRLGPVTSIDMSRGLGVVNNNSLNSNVLLGPISNMRQDYPMMSEASNTLYDDDKPTLMEAPQEGSSLDRYNAIQDYLSSLDSFGYARGGRMYDKGGVTSSNGQYHVEPSEYSGVLNNVSNGNPLEVTLPDTTVTANDPRNYRSYYDPSGAGEFMDAATLGLFPNPFNLSRSASTFMQKPSWDSAWDTTKDALMFAGSTGKEAAFAPLGLMNLVDKDGVRKTYSLAKEGNYAGAAMSGLGDALNVGMVAGPTYKVGKEIYGIGKELYDTGALWDKYTTFQGRFGNYGDNLLTNMYGTYARRLGLPDKARLPADAIRKLRQEVTIDSDGMVNFTGHKGFVGNPHINTTLDRPVVSHDPKGKADWDGADTYLFPVKDLINQTKGGSLKSIEPSDAFANGAEISISPDKVTVISGDVNTLERAKAAGMQTLSSPRLRRMYARENNNYQNAVSNANSFMKRTIKPPKKELGLPYATEMQRLQSMRGTPTLADFRLLEQQTGLNAGVAPMEEYQNAINSLNSMLNPSIQDIMNGTVKPYVYPNGREVDFIPDHIKKELGLIQRANYNNVFYDPATWAEFNWKERIGLE